MWICPKCETFNRDGDKRCFICACEYKVYLYHQDMKQKEAASAAKAKAAKAAEESRIAAKVAVAAQKAKAERPGSSSAASSSPPTASYKAERADFIRELDADRSKPSRPSSTPKPPSPQKSHTGWWIALIILGILIFANIADSRSSGDESSSSNKTAVYSFSMEYTPEQVIECQYDTYFL